MALSFIGGSSLPKGMALAASQVPEGQRRTLVLPPSSAAEAARITQLDVRVAHHLRVVVGLQ